MKKTEKCFGKKFYLIATVFIFSLFCIAPCRYAFAGEVNLSLSPSSYSYSKGEIFAVSVVVETGETSINAAEALINFSAENIEIKKISFDRSIFNIWTSQPFHSNEEGFISFGGGLPNPGFIGENGEICTIYFKAKKENSSNISFRKARVLANDGKGTDVLDGLGKGSYSYDSQYDPLFALSVNIFKNSKNVKAGGDLEFEMIIVNENPKQDSEFETGALLSYLVRDDKEKIVFQKKENHIIKDLQGTVKKKFQIPLNLRPGNYRLEVDMEYNSNIISDSDNFSVIKDVKSFNQGYLILFVVIILILLAVYKIFSRKKI